MLIGRLLVISCVMLLAACASSSKNSSSSVNYQKALTTTAPVVILGPGDVLDIKFRFLPELDYQQSIRPDGKISLQMVDEVVAAGLTPEALDNHLTDLYSSKLKSPEITVIVVSLANQNIYVGGEVEAPGLLTLTGNLTALQAVINAGGFSETAAPQSAIVIRKGIDNQPVPLAINLQEIIDGRSQGADIVLQPEDVVYVPKSAIANANKFVKQYIQDLLLFRGIGVGFSYEIRADN